MKMPQMSPMNWLFLFLLTYFFFYLTISKMFFFSKSVTSSQSNYFHFNKFLFKI